MINILHKRFGKLTALMSVGKNKSKHPLWLCICDCGESKAVSAYKLLDGHTMSCGCIKRNMVAFRNTKHGLSKTLEYNSWQTMNVRCNNKNNPSFPSYGGRGITICDRWRDFANFIDDMGARPKGTTLDRIDVNGNYEPSNCRWADNYVQAQNKRSNVNITFQGITLCLQEWSRKTGIDRRKISDRIARGWSIERALTT